MVIINIVRSGKVSLSVVHELGITASYSRAINLDDV